RELGPGRVLAVHPGSGSPRKNWPADRFAEVATRFVERTRGRVLLVAGYADDAPREDFLRAFGGSDSLLEARSRPLPELASLLGCSSVYLGNDSGVTHLAASVGAPTLALFGTGSAPMFRPTGKRVRVLGGKDLRSLPPSLVWGRIRSSLPATDPPRRRDGSRS
ncbi:MAG: glycosyltransferase family 9 protein, partial [Planctomycetota bacterium]